MNFTIPLDMVVGFVYVLARFGGLVTFVPFWSNSAVNAKTRILLALMLAFVAYPVVSVSMTIESLDPGKIAINLFGELMIGFAIGLVVRFIFAAIEFAGQMIGFQMGLSIVNAIDPQTQVRVPTFSAFFTFFASVVFLMVDAHHWCLIAVFQSYDHAPVGGFHLNGQLVELLINLAGQIFATGLQLSAAVVAVLVVVDIALGIVSRAAPQIQLLVISFPIKIMAGLLVLGFSLYFFPSAVESYLHKMQLNLLKVVTLLNG